MFTYIGSAHAPPGQNDPFLGYETLFPGYPSGAPKKGKACEVGHMAE